VPDFLKAGTRLIWVVYPDSKTVDVYRSADARIVDVVTADGTLSGDDVLPGFQLPLRDVFTSIGG